MVDTDNYINSPNNPLVTIFFYSFLLGFSFLLTNGFYLRLAEPLMFPNDWLARIGSVLLFSLFFCFFAQRPFQIFRLLSNKYGLMTILFFFCILFPTITIGWLFEQRQPLIRPSLVSIRLYSGLLVFFSLAVFCKSDTLFRKLNNFVLAFGVIWLIFLFFAFFFPDLAMEIYKRPAKDIMIRLDTIRFAPPVGARVAIMYTCFYGFLTFVKRPSMQTSLWLIVYLIGVFDILYVCMLRRHSAAMLIVPLLYVLLFMNWSRKAIVSFSVAGILIILLCAFPSVVHRGEWIVKSAIEELKSKQATSANARIRTFEYYYPEFIRSYGIGYGYYPSQLPPQKRYLINGKKVGYYEGDLGVVMALLMYGIQAIIWTIVMYFFIFKDLSTSQYFDYEFPIIRSALAATFLWSFLTLNAFVWGYSEPFWWGIMIFMVYYISKFCREG